MKKKLVIMETPQKNVEEITEFDNSNKNEDKNVETKEDTKMEDISSNLEGYPSSKDDIGKNEVEGSREKNEGSKNAGTEEYQGGDTQRIDEENVVEELGKEKDLGREEEKGMENPRENEVEDLALGISLSFLDIAKIKVDSSLWRDSWIYNEIMKLKSKLCKMQKEQEIDHAKIGMLETQVGNILEKLKEYE